MVKTVSDLIAQAFRTLIMCNEQGRINHGANRTKSRGLALQYQNTFLLIFCVFRLFTTRQNCRVFNLPRLAYRLKKLSTLSFIVFEWLKKNWTKQHHALWASIQWFQINPDCTPKKHIRTIKIKKADVTTQTYECAYSNSNGNRILI